MRLHSCLQLSVARAGHLVKQCSGLFVCGGTATPTAARTSSKALDGHAEASQSCLLRVVVGRQGLRVQNRLFCFNRRCSQDVFRKASHRSVFSRAWGRCACRRTPEVRPCQGGAVCTFSCPGVRWHGTTTIRDSVASQCLHPVACK